MTNVDSRNDWYMWMRSDTYTTYPPYSSYFYCDTMNMKHIIAWETNVMNTAGILLSFEI